jgi:hypothetical protein
MEDVISGQPSAGSQNSSSSAPIHCVIGGSGYRVGSWPKEGLFCERCLTFAVKGLKAERYRHEVELTGKATNEISKETRGTRESNEKREC